MPRTIVPERGGYWIGRLLTIYRPTPRTDPAPRIADGRFPLHWRWRSEGDGFLRLDSARRPFRRVVLTAVADLDLLARLIVPPVGALGLLGRVDVALIVPQLKTVLLVLPLDYETEGQKNHRQEGTFGT